jgi:hypothetical protein
MALHAGVLARADNLFPQSQQKYFVGFDLIPKTCMNNQKKINKNRTAGFERVIRNFFNLMSVLYFGEQI